jgi:uncharacterized DUF497 family protein
MEYEWDPDRNRSNFAKHGFDFEDAEVVFDGPCFTFEDHRFDYGEMRLVTIGLLARTASRYHPCSARGNYPDHLDEKGDVT